MFGIKGRDSVLRWYQDGETTGNFMVPNIHADYIVRYVLRKTGLAHHHTQEVKCEDLELFDNDHKHKKYPMRHIVYFGDHKHKAYGAIN